MEPVAESEVGVDEGLVRERLFELPAQLPHVHIDRPLLPAERPAPHHRVELFPTDDPATSTCQRSQQAELAHGEGYWASVREREELARPDFQPALPQDFVGSCFHFEGELCQKGRKVRYERVIAL